MKQISQAVLTIFLLFSYSIIASARLLPPHEGSSLKIQDDDLFNNLMGLEECDDDKDEDCIKRRMVSEAHLDYIYTQHHKPKESP
ncbi:putative phytosulfokines 6 isoform X2 [Camellia sinensis]|uniref:putative phytosulfokines 6 isoform X2 n=1 Tax=Camellia sinensis TaxID=4442 RepID=UPI001036EFB0|nr:putative phytosulfokines 6 isoform X2 [Camellia sinensis]